MGTPLSFRRTTSHLQTLDRAMAVGTQLVQESLAPYLIVTSDHEHYSVLSADDYEAQFSATDNPPQVVCHMNI